MVVGSPFSLPEEAAFAFLDGKIVDGSFAPLHQSVSAEPPLLIAMRAKPVAIGIVPLIGEADGDLVAGKGPDLLDQPVVVLLGPFAREKGNSGVPADQEFGAVPPPWIGRVGQ